MPIEAGVSMQHARRPSSSALTADTLLADPVSSRRSAYAIMKLVGVNRSTCFGCGAFKLSLCVCVTVFASGQSLTC